MGENRAAASGLFAGEDKLKRCIWCQASEAYRHYHDHEWGFPVIDETRLFEKICLEGFQAGLSWSTILHKRPAFREAFAGFDMERVARFGARDVQRLMDNAGIVRHRGKIDSAINNAKRAIELREQYGSLAAYLWRYEPERASRPKRITYEALRTMTTSPESVALSKDLKKRGWTFVGPTTMYALMQAMGLVNDHVDGCHARKQALAARVDLQVPV
ncbi:DNA-3-methyladenine glycosylase I [Candidimonas humi]|jgi:DNA-3-methyladenine glycosylase I|uniref:DNA-3-methyladenine glycosylase I n=1 Tax=Candidimonas humi TaxID=683355 RepID=A0ABV8NS18_9BURK|nr:DNA-3-methyladenine glycosylase I [Candidimonas humi]MBV6303418.1 DNA-3-methyladenine glycosylase I [Candidimonas humi]